MVDTLDKQFRYVICLKYLYNDQFILIKIPYKYNFSINIYEF